MKTKKILISSLCVLLSVSLFFSIFELFEIQDLLSVNQYIKYHSRSEIPNEYKWDVSHVYSSAEELGDEIEKTNALLLQCAHSLKEVKPQDVNKLLDDYFELEQKAKKMSNYMQLHRLIGEGDKIEQGDIIESIYKKTSSIYRYICTIIVSFSQEEIKQIYTNSVKYQKVIDYVRKHQDEMKGDEKLNDIVNQIKQNYHTITDSISFPTVKYSDGSTLNLNYSSFILCMQNKNRNLREEVYSTYYNTYKSNSESLAENLLEYAFYCDMYSKTKGFNSTLEFSLWRTGVNENIFNSAVDAVLENTALLSQYNRKKKSILSLPDYEMYDVYVSPYKERNIYIPYEEAKKIIIAALTPLGEEYITVVERAFEENWIDVYSTRDKDDSSLQVDFFDVHPYILINYQGTESDLYTLVHELGHAVQSYMLSDKYEYWEFGVPEFLVEIPSTLNEILLSEYFINSVSEESEYMNSTFKYLDKIKTNVFKQAQITLFELKLYDNEIDTNNIGTIYKEINDLFYGETVNSDQLISYEWCRLSSLYMNFYAYQYITSFGAAMYIFNSLNSKKEALFISKYDDPIEYMREYDVDFESKSMYNILFDKMNQLLLTVK